MAFKMDKSRIDLRGNAHTPGNFSIEAETNNQGMNGDNLMQMKDDSYGGPINQNEENGCKPGQVKVDGNCMSKSSAAALARARRTPEQKASDKARMKKANDSIKANKPFISYDLKSNTLPRN